MKKTNKILSFVLALLMLTSVFIIPVNAEAIPFAELTIEADKTEVDVGDTVTLDVYIEENSNLSALTVDLVYDSSVFDIVEMISHGMFNYNHDVYESINFWYDDGKARFVGATPDRVTEEGILFTVVLEAICEADTSDIYLEVEEATNNYEDYVQVFTNTVSVSVTNNLLNTDVPSIFILTDKTEVEIGDTVVVNVFLSEDTDLGAITLDFLYDPSAFEIISMTAGDLFPTTEEFDGTNPYFNNGVARYTGATASSVMDGGLLFTIVFEVIDEVYNSEMLVDVTEAVDSDWNAIDFWSNTVTFNFFDVYVKPYIEICKPSRTTIRHKDGIVLSYYAEGEFPCIGNFVWSWDNDNFDVEDNGDGTITIISKNNGYTTFTISYIDATGEAFVYDTIEMRSKAGFFDKIGSFFRSIFGLTEIYPW